MVMKRDLVKIFVLFMLLAPALAGCRYGTPEPIIYDVGISTTINGDGYFCIADEVWAICNTQNAGKIVSYEGFLNYLCLDRKWKECAIPEDFVMTAGNSYYCNSTSWKACNSTYNEIIQLYNSNEWLCYNNSTLGSYYWEKCDNIKLRGNRKYYCNLTSNWYICKENGVKSNEYQCKDSKWVTAKGSGCKSNEECFTGFCDNSLTYQLQGICSDPGKATCDGIDQVPAGEAGGCTCNKHCKFDLGLVCVSGISKCTNICPMGTCPTNKACWKYKGISGCFPSLKQIGFLIDGSDSSIFVDRDNSMQIEANISTLTNGPTETYTIDGVEIAFKIRSGACPGDPLATTSSKTYNFVPEPTVVTLEYQSNLIGDLCFIPSASDYFIDKIGGGTTANGLTVCINDIAEPLNKSVYITPQANNEAIANWNVTLSYSAVCTGTGPLNYNLTLFNATDNIVSHLPDQISPPPTPNPILSITNDKFLCSGWSAKIVGFDSSHPQIQESWTVTGTYSDLGTSCSDNSQCCSGNCANGTNFKYDRCCSTGQCSNGTNCVAQGTLIKIGDIDHACSMCGWRPSCTSSNTATGCFCYAPEGTTLACQQACSSGSLEGVLAADSGACCSQACYTQGKCYNSTALINSTYVCYQGLKYCNTTAYGGWSGYEPEDVLDVGPFEYLCTNNGWVASSSEQVLLVKNHQYLSINSTLTNQWGWLECTVNYLPNTQISDSDSCRTYSGNCNATVCPGVACLSSEKAKMNASTSDSNGAAFSAGWWGKLRSTNWLCSVRSNLTSWDECYEEYNKGKIIGAANAWYICDQEWKRCYGDNLNEEINTTWGVKYECDQYGGWLISKGYVCPRNSACRSGWCADAWRGGLRCCFAGECWDDTKPTPGCVKSGSKLCAADTSCIYTRTESRNIVCTSEGWREYQPEAPKEFGVNASIYVCDTDTVEECLGTQPVEGIVEAETGKFIVLEFKVSLGTEPIKANVSVTLDGIKLKESESSGDATKLDLDVGTHNIIVRAYKPEYGIKTITRIIRVSIPSISQPGQLPTGPQAPTVESKFNLDQDKTTISKRVQDLKSRIAELQKRGIEAVVPNQLIRKVESMSLTDAESITDALGSLDEAERVLNYIETANLPLEGGMDLGKLLLGILAVAAGVGIVAYLYLGRPPKPEAIPGLIEEKKPPEPPAPVPRVPLEPLPPPEPPPPFIK